MKRFLISMAALLAVVGCAKQDDLVSAEFGTTNAPEFEVGFETSRVYIEEDEDGYKLSWTSGDLLSCFFNTGGQAKYEYVGETGADNGIIKAVSCPSGTTLDKFYAVYPYNEGNKLTGDVLTVVLPSEQTYAEGTFGANSNTMVAVNADGEPYYTFSNVCGYVRLKIYGDATITSIKFEGNNGEIIAGEADVNPTTKELTISAEGDKAIYIKAEGGASLGLSEAEATEFWVVVPPVTFEKGFTVTLTDAQGNSMKRATHMKYVVARNQVNSMGVVAYVPESSDDIIFDAQFNLDGTATDNGKFKLPIKVTTNENGETPYYEVHKNPTYPHNNIVRMDRVPMNDQQLRHSNSHLYAELNNDFNAAIADGATVEIIMGQPMFAAGTFARIFSTEKWGLIERGYTATEYPYSVPFFGDWWGNATCLPATPAPEARKYHHLMLVYNPDNKEQHLYKDGVLVGTRGGDVKWEASKILGLGFMPYNGDVSTALQPICAEFGMFRVYDSKYTAEDVLNRYKSLTLPSAPAYDHYEYAKPLVDISFDANANIVNNGSLEAGDAAVLKLDKVAGPYLKAVQVGDKYVASFSRGYGLNSNHDGVAVDNLNNSYYNIYGEELLNKINDGEFTIEIIASGTAETTLVAPMSSQSFKLNIINNDGYKAFMPYSRSSQRGELPSIDYFTPAPGTVKHMKADPEKFVHFIISYDKVIGNLSGFYDGQVVDINPDGWKAVDGGLNAATSVVLGADVVNGLNQRFNGKIASVRIHDEAYHGYKAYNLINLRRAEVEALNSVTIAPEPAVVVPQPIVDVQFAADGTATDKVNNYTITKVDGTTNPTVTKLANNDYTLNTGVATFGNDVVNAGYYKLDYTNEAKLKEAINNGYTVEVIHASKNNNTTWGGLFGTEAHSIGRLAGYGYKWNINYTDANGVWHWCDGQLSPANDKWYHTIFTWDGNTMSVYRNGVFENSRIANDAKESNYMLIGARLNHEREFVPGHGWGGEIALFRIYDESVDARVAEALYEQAKTPMSKIVLNELTDVLFDAKFNADGSAENVGSMRGLGIVAQGGSTVTTYKKGDQYVALLDNATKNNYEQTSGFYYVDYTSNSMFKEHLTDGFTMEVLCKPNMYYQNYWATPFSLSTCRVHHNLLDTNNATWSFVASAAENKWDDDGIFNSWYWGNFSPVIVNAYQHVVLTYDGVNSWDMIVNGKNNGPWENPTALNPGNALAIGAIAYTGGVGYHNFCGEIAIARIYDNAKSVDEVVARYNELKPLIETLNTETTSEYKFDLLVDVEFAESGATDKANGYAITTETVGTGGNLSVANGIATFGADNANLSYYNIDLAQGDGTLKTEMNNGFTIEAILSSTTSNPQWACPFGSEGFSLVRLAGYGYKWNINGWNTANGWPYTDGVIAPVAGLYYHILYTYDASTGRVRVYRNGLCENKGLLSFAMRENSNLLIGARNDNGTIQQPWDGNIASLKIYKQAVPYTVEAEALYKAAQAQVESLNGN